MQTLLDALHNAVRLLGSFDADVLEYSGRSLLLATVATIVASFLGVPLGVLLAERDFPGKRPLVIVLHTLLAVPTVVVGLLVYTFLSRTGPLGGWNLLWTVPGILIGEVLLVLPLVVVFTFTAVARTDRDLRKTAMTLGAGPIRILWTVLCESRFAVLAAVVAAFGRVISEVGIAMILGGNADHFTRTLTTAIVLNVDMGNFAPALALGIVLLVVSLSVNVLLLRLQGKGAD